MAANDEPTTPVIENSHAGALPRDTSLGRYRVVRTLGQGGFGITYLAHDTQLNRDVAIKEYLPEIFALRGNDGVVLPRSTRVASDFLWGRERFLEEARILARFSGTAGLVDVYDFLEGNGTAYMVMALIRGETLDDRLKRERHLQQAALERILVPLLDGLERVHEADVLHRDIKPSNIMIDASGRGTLIDFGASRIAVQGRSHPLTAIYTPGYAAFEQITARKQGPWTDLYALAATLYHCVTGRPPPPSPDRMIEDDFVPATQAASGRYSPHLLHAIDVALAVKPADRPQSIAAWRALVFPSVESEQPESRPAATAAQPTVAETTAAVAQPTAARPTAAEPTAMVAPPPAVEPKATAAQRTAVLETAPVDFAAATTPAEVVTVVQQGIVPSVPPRGTGSRRRMTWGTIMGAAAVVLSIVSGGAWLFELIPQDISDRTRRDASTGQEVWASIDRLGFVVSTISSARRETYRIPTQVSGLVVVQTDVEAYASGVVAGDVLVEIDGRRISRPEDLKTWTLSLPKGRTARAEFFRGGRSFILNLRLR